MNPVDRDQVFRELEPPPAGLTRLRARLDAEERARRRVARSWVAAAAVAAACIAVVLTAPERGAEVPLRDAPGLVRVGAAPFPDEAVTVPGTARTELAVLAVAQTPDVVFYRVATRRAGALE